MWRTIKYSVTGKPLIDINEQGVVYSYQTRQLKPLRQNTSANHYLYWAEGTSTCYVHREVAKAFPEICGDWFEGCEVHHIDGDPLNNEAKNLIVFPWAVPIIKHYKTLPVISNQVYNRYLKEINSSLTSHMGRRTYATLLYNKKVSMDAVAAALGDNPQIAARYYAKVFDSTILTEQMVAFK